MDLKHTVYEPARIVLRLTADDDALTAPEKVRGGLVGTYGPLNASNGGEAARWRIHFPNEDTRVETEPGSDPAV
jgi:hypothetical protein